MSTLKRISATAFLGGVFLVAFQCAKTPDQEKKPATTPKASVQAVCLFDGVSMRAEPRKSGKWLASISLGETVQWLGESRIDSADKNREYVKVGLSDGKTGWSSAYGLVKGSRPGALKEDAPIHKRPDLLTLTENRIDFLTMAAVAEVQGEWAKVVTERRKKSGWVKLSAVTTAKNDVVTAILASRELQKKDGASEAEKIRSILDNPQLPESFFTAKLREIANSMTALAPKDTVAEDEVQAQ